ncbi:Ff.00g005540.m01.CDS01 [Fusarium sp. VM40]|nr:Ff.00g005540.m01.CDS01 [Fusarium sp. VM40]
MADSIIRTESQASHIIGIAVGFVVASGIIVLLRVYARLVLLGLAGPDDWTILAATGIAIVDSVSTVMEAKHGMGRHKENVSVEDSIEQLKYLYVAILLYNVGMNIVKVSFLFQYRRIFQSSRVQNICFWVIIGVILWACVQTTLLGTSCLPVSILVPSTAGWCLDTLPVWYISSAISIATDVIIFCIPLPSVWKLQLPIKQKIMVILIFCLGFFVCIISVYRMCTLREAVYSNDPPWNGAGAAIWSVIELNCAIICASLPTLRPLIAKVVPGMSSSNSNYASYERYGSQYAPGSNLRLGAHASVKASRRSPRSISTEELALNDMNSAMQSGMPSTYAESRSLRLEHGNLKRIMVTTETSVSNQSKY